MKRIFIFEQNVAYLTAVTILSIKKNLLQKYFKGFKDLIQQKKRPRDQVMKMNKLRKCFAGWKTFTSKQQGLKLFVSSILDIQKDQKKKFYSKLQQNNQLHEARHYYKIHRTLKVLQSWYGITQSSQKVTYLVKLLNQQKLKQLKKQFQILSDSFKLSNLIEQGKANLQSKSFLKWKKKYQRRQILRRFGLFLETKEKDNISYGLSALKENIIDQQIQEILSKKLLEKLFMGWKNTWQKKSYLKILCNIFDNKISKIQSRFLHKINNLSKFKQLRTIKIRCVKKAYLKKWSKQLKKVQAIQVLQKAIDSIKKRQFNKCSKTLFNINEQQIYNTQVEQQQKLRLFTKWIQLTNQKQRLAHFVEILTRIFEQKTYYKHCRSLLFFSLKNQQIKQLKGEFALKAFAQLVCNRQAMIFGQLQQDQQYLSFLEEKNRRTQIFCFTLWAKLTNESIAYKFICKSLLEIYKRNMKNNMRVIKNYGDSNHIIYKKLDDNKRKSILNLWFNQTQKRIAIKSIFGCLEANYDSFQNKQQHVKAFMNILKQASTTHQNATQLFTVIRTKFLQCMAKTVQKINSSTKGQIINNNKRKNLKQRSLRQWRKLKSLLSLTTIMQGAYERVLNLNLNKLKNKLRIQKANQHYEQRLQNLLISFLKAAVHSTKVKLELLEKNQNQQFVNIHFQIWFIECLKRNNQRKCLQRICRGFFLYHYRTQGADLIKQLKLEKKLY
ncbi:hypothetical protein FGO68_gene9580 [Halteria grandinella]|uniref:Sfi1 spindle body domain-containing protein n=1 Tax=Halteria grandinella TaxID=5974 RepID=A0A8J8NI43_HALGN|nr:hypothetical protein FGO68_gene9580 [Halteria grandinella]